MLRTEPLQLSCAKGFEIRAGKPGANDSGTGSGLGNIKGYLDTYGTMTVDGAFLESCEYLLTAGFLADGHGAAFGYHYPTVAEIGIFTDVQETKEGLQLSWEYHDDPHSQAVRAKTQKRLDNDKTCGLSIGFFVGDGKNPPTGWVYSDKEKEPKGIDYIVVEREFYDTLLPIYSAPEYLEDNLARAESLPCIYLLKRVHVFETSQTEIPANEVSLITEVRARSQRMPNTKSESRAKASAAAQETHDQLKRALSRAKDAHEELSDHLAKCSKLARTLENHLSNREEDDDEGGEEEKPAKGKGEDKKARARAIFEGK